MKVNIKKIDPAAIIPCYAKPGDAGMDLTAIKCEVNADVLTCHTGLAIEIPEGHVGLIYPRSSIYKKALTLANSVGVIDSGYRGELILKFKIHSHSNSDNVYSEGDRVGQIIIVPYPRIELEEVSELSSTKRGPGGFGSTGV